MLIRSQNKNTLFMLDKFMCIGIEPIKIKDGVRYSAKDKYEADVMAVNIVCKNGEEFSLGEYKTEEKAKKVLDMLFENYRNLQFADGIRFQMPQDSEV